MLWSDAGSGFEERKVAGLVGGLAPEAAHLGRGIDPGPDRGQAHTATPQAARSAGQDMTEAALLRLDGCCVRLKKCCDDVVCRGRCLQPCVVDCLGPSRLLALMMCALLFLFSG